MLINSLNKKLFIFTLIYSLAIPIYASSFTKIIKQLTKLTIVVGTTTSVVYILEKYDFKEIDASTGIKKASDEAENARSEEKKEYRISFCLNKDGEKVALPKSFSHCPYGDNKIYKGPLLKFS